MSKAIVNIALLCLILISGCKQAKRNPSYGGKEWTEYLGGPERNHFSPLKQINTSNVKKLQLAWEYHTLDSGQIQCNPIAVNGLLYGMTATTEPFALNAATGKEIWRIKSDSVTKFSTSRGLAYWEDRTDKRILYTNGSWLYAVNAGTGKAIRTFGDRGRVSLKAGLGHSASGKMVISNTPGSIYENLIIMPLRLSEGADAAPGYIQAFDVRTGKLAWTFHTIPQPGEYGYETWPKEAYKNKDVGGGNNWAGMAVDRQRGIIYIPTGSAAFDFYGGNRKGANLFANCILALDAKTGKRLWHFQFVHHDILDRDPPAPPNLMTINHNGNKVDVVVQITKQGFVFVFDRVTGKPIFPVKEVQVPQSDIPGEESWPTQPIPELPAPFARQYLTASDISSLAANRQELIDSLRKSRSEGPFTPLSKGSTIVYPGLDGGAEWGGAAADPEGVLYLNSNEMAWRIYLRKAKSKKELISMPAGQRLYTQNCISCHGAERKGNPKSGYPSLVNISSRRSADYIKNIIGHGKGMMPAFTRISVAEKEALIAYLSGKTEVRPGLGKEPVGNAGQDMDNQYEISGYNKFLDKDGYPAVRTPWGTLNAIDMNTGKYLWKISFGEIPELMKKGIPATGSESYGGPVITSGGLLFIAATKDGKFRAYDKKNGKLLWETRLPAAGFATPSTYEVNGRQFIVIACGGTKLGTPSGESYVAFALPDPSKQQ